MKLSNLQYSLTRFAIYMVLYILYILVMYCAIKTYFDPRFWTPTAALFTAVALGSLLFGRLMPKRRLVVTVTEG